MACSYCDAEETRCTSDGGAVHCLRGRLTQARSDARQWHGEYKYARQKKNEAISKNMRLREALDRAYCAMDGATVFVTSRERIKQPEGDQWWAEEIAAARAALDGVGHE